MVILGVILAIVGALIDVGLLLTLGVILIVVGLILNFMPAPAGGTRRRYW